MRHSLSCIKCKTICFPKFITNKKYGISENSSHHIHHFCEKCKGCGPCLNFSLTFSTPHGSHGSSLDSIEQYNLEDRSIEDFFENEYGFNMHIKTIFVFKKIFNGAIF